MRCRYISPCARDVRGSCDADVTQAPRCTVGAVPRAGTGQRVIVYYPLPRDFPADLVFWTI